MSDVMWPVDLADLRTTLDQVGVPVWWPLPDTVAPPTAPYSTVQHLSASDTITRGGNQDSSGFGWTSCWLVDAPDLAAAESSLLSKVPTDRYDVATGSTSRSEVIENGRRTVSYAFPLHDESASGGLSMKLKDAIHPDTGERLGALVELSESEAAFGVPTPVPIGTAPARQFLAEAPVSSHMLWHETFVQVEGAVSLYFDEALLEPHGVYKATWEVAGVDLDDVIAFLSDPTNFTGDLKPSAAGEFTSDDLWTMRVGYQGLAGEYSLLMGDPDDDKFVFLKFTLPP